MAIANCLFAVPPRGQRAEWLQNLGLVDTLSGQLLERIENYGRRFSGLMEPGDEIWEWKTGTDDFGAAGGFAILREGDIIWADATWRS